LPNSNDAAKRHRQNLKSRTRNRSVKKTVKTSLKTLEESLQKKDKSAAEENFKQFIKLIDTATQKGVYHKNTAARKKSRLHKRLNHL
jgi:small subunit ribosomal protein S20